MGTPCFGAAGERGVLWVGIRGIEWFRDRCMKQLVLKMGRRREETLMFSSCMFKCQIWMHVGDLKKFLTL